MARLGRVLGRDIRPDSVSLAWFENINNLDREVGYWLSSQHGDFPWFNLNNLVEHGLSYRVENWTQLIWAMLGGWVTYTLVVFWLMPRIRFGVGATHVKVSLFGIPLRRIALQDITRVSKRLKGRAEIWRNTLQADHRMLVIYRNRGLFKAVVITPRNRYVFRNEIAQAIDRLKANKVARESELKD